MMLKVAKKHRGIGGLKTAFIMLGALPALLSCAHVDAPGARNLKIPSPTVAEERAEAVNDNPDTVLYLPLGSDVLVPETNNSLLLPKEVIGPFELRSETLAGALQLILADYEVPLAFETEEALTRTITVANLRGPLDSVVNKVCALADLYCAFEDGLLVIKETQTFTVSVPPIGGEDDIINSLATGLEAITGVAPIVETGTRTILYEATSRTADLAERYFQRVRTNTALIVFEIYIWEVGLNSDNRSGIDWTEFGSIGGSAISIPGGIPAGGVAGGAAPVSIGLPGDLFGTFNTNNVLEFISSYGAVKTISQPQITVLSGAEATLRAADTINFVSSFTRTTDNGDVSVSTETDSVDTGFTLTIGSAWDNSTIYGDVNIDLQEFRLFRTFGEGTDTQISLPETVERELSTQIRIRPGDSLLIAGLVREVDQFDSSGPGFDQPIFPTSRAATISNTELVFLLKPRVIVYTSEGDPNHVSPNSSQDISEQETPKDEPVIPVPVPEAIIENNEARGRQLDYNEEFPAGTLDKEMLNPAG